MVTGLLCISMLPVVPLCICMLVNIHVNKKMMTKNINLTKKNSKRDTVHHCRFVKMGVESKKVLSRAQWRIKRRLSI